jgi:hypothetical protein
MANVFQNTTLVAKTALAMFENNFPYAMLSNRGYQGEFLQGPYQKGDTVTIRRQNFFDGGEGATITPEDITETVEQLTIEKQFWQAVSVTSRELTLNLEDFGQEVLKPAIQKIVSDCETYISNKAKTDLYFHCGSATADLNSYSSVSQAGVRLLEQGVNLTDNAYFASTVKDADAVKAAALAQFTPVINDQIYKTAAVGHISYFDMFWSQSIAQQTAGVGPTTYPSDTLTVNGAVSSGNTIVLAGATASQTGYFKAGDVISIANVYNLNPVNKQSTGRNAQFVILADANSSAGGAVTITVAPDIIVTGSSRNVSGAIPNGAAVTVNKSHNVNVAFNRRSLDVICPPIKKLQVPYCEVVTDEKTGLSIRIAMLGDIINDKNIIRLDTLIGAKWHPQYATRVLSRIGGA